MTARSTAIDYAAWRLVVALPGTYDAAREHYETLVPQVDSARFFQMASWLEHRPRNAAAQRGNPPPARHTDSTEFPESSVFGFRPSSCISDAGGPSDRGPSYAQLCNGHGLLPPRHSPRCASG
jgi:hypothetical protein